MSIYDFLKYILIALSLSMLSSCAEETTIAECSASLPVAAFTDDFEAGQSWPRGLATNGKWSYEVDPKYGEPIDGDKIPVAIPPIMIESNISRAGSNSVKFTVQPDDVVAGGNRSELKMHVSDNDPVCSEAWYAWSLYVPADYEPPSSNDGFQVVGQFHARVDPDDPASINGVPISFGIRQAEHIRNQDNFDKLVIKLNQLESNVIVDEVIAEDELVFGTWKDMVIHVKWSVYKDGFIEIWTRDVPNPASVIPPYEPITFTTTGTTRQNGSTMYNLLPNYFKIGLYRNEAVPEFSDTTGIVYYDEVRRGNSFSDVAL